MMEAELYLGSCEQFRYTVEAPTKKLLREKLLDIMFPRYRWGYDARTKRHAFRKLPPLHKPGYGLPAGAVHYKVDGYRWGTILVIYRGVS